MKSKYADLNVWDHVNSKVIDVLNNSCIDTIGLSDEQIENIVYEVSKNCLRDVDFLIKIDPGFSNTDKIESNPGVEAVIYYRISNSIYECNEIDEIPRNAISYKINEEIKNRLKIDLNPAAKIGVPFILNRGFGTIIEKSVRVGNSCCFHNCVTIGKDARKGGSGYPTIGDYVEIRPHVGVYGPINIGNNVVIHPYCMIGVDIPNNHIVSISNQIQSCQIKSEGNSEFNIVIYGIVPQKEGELLIFGDHLNFSDIYLADKKYETIKFLKITVLQKTENQILLKLSIDDAMKNIDMRKLIDNVKIVIEILNNQVVILKSPGLKKAIKTCIDREGVRK